MWKIFSFNSDNSYLFSCSRNAQVNFLEKPQSKKPSFQNKNFDVVSTKEFFKRKLYILVQAYSGEVAELPGKLISHGKRIVYFFIEILGAPRLSSFSLKSIHFSFVEILKIIFKFLIGTPHLTSGIGTVSIYYSTTTKSKVERFLQALLWDGVYPDIKIYRLKV